MKNKYVKPVMQVEEFMADNYVALNCSKDKNHYGITINFKCDAGGGTYGCVWKESNGTPGLQSSGSNTDKCLTESGQFLFWGGNPTNSFHACNVTHSVDVTGVKTIDEAIATQSDIFKGYYKVVRKNDSEAMPVTVWTNKGTNVHCTTLEPKQWTLAKS